MSMILKNKGLSKASKSLLSLSALTILLSVSAMTPAMADDRHDQGRGRGIERDREWDRHERGAYNWHRHHRVIVEAPPQVVYAPPAVVYGPPPISPGLTLILPLNIR